MKWLLLLLLVAVAVPQVQAAATIAEIYAAPSEAEEFDTGTGICTDISLHCSDTQYGNVFDHYTSLGDGSTTSGASIRNNDANAAGFLRIVFDIDGLLDGNYTIRFSKSTTGTFPYLVCPYINETDINSSECISGTTEDSVWNEIDITSIVQAQAPLTDNRITIRFVNNQANAHTITETYIKRPFKESDFQIIPQGVVTADINQWLENEWLIVSQSQISLTGGTCDIYELGETHILLNENITKMNVSLDTDGAKLKVRWFSNETIINAGVNYEVDCELFGSGATLAGLEQYVYMTVDGDIFDDIVDILDTVLRMLGLIEDPVIVNQVTKQVPADGNVNLQVQVTSGEQLYTGALCNSSITDSTGSQIYTEELMQDLSTGMYNFTFANNGNAPYETQIACQVNDTTGEFRTYWTSGTILAGSSEIYEGTPELTIVQSQYYTTSTANILAQLRRGSTMVDDASCGLTTYYPNGTKFIDAQSMSYLGENGLYNYSWTPDFVSGGYPTTVNCSGGKMGALQIQSIGSLTVSDGVRMAMIS